MMIAKLPRPAAAGCAAGLYFIIGCRTIEAAPSPSASDEYENAAEDFQAALKEASVLRDGHMLLWLAITQLHEGAIDQTLPEKYPQSSWPSAWPRPILDYLFGRTSRSDLINAVMTSTKSADQRSEAYFFLAESEFLRGRTREAQDDWQSVLMQGTSGQIENSSARFRLHLPPQ